MRMVLLFCLIALPLSAQAFKERIVDYFLLGPQVMREVEYLYHSSRNIQDYKALRTRVLSSRAPWYIRWIGAFFESSLERQLERLWLRVHKQFSRIALLEKEGPSRLISEYSQKAQFLKVRVANIIDAPIPTGSLTNYDMYRRSNQLLGEVIRELLQWYVDILGLIDRYFLDKNMELVSSDTRFSLARGLEETIQIKKEYDFLGVSKIDLWYMTKVDKQLQSYTDRLSEPKMIPMSAKKRY